MKRIRSRRLILYIAALTLLLPGRGGTDIGSLQPVEVVQLYKRNELLFIETDTGDLGWGMTAGDAVKKLKETTPGQIYLDTADYLLIDAGLEEYLPDLRSYLKKRTAMAYGQEEIDLQEAAAYLSVHRPARTIGKWRKPGEVLTVEGGKLILKKIKEK